MKKSLIITTINDVNHNIRILAKLSEKIGSEFIIVGDKKSPSKFKIKNGSYFDIDSQEKLDFEIVKNSPYNTYTRKNIGYLIAIKNSSDIIIETDDDNMPYESYKPFLDLEIETEKVLEKGWVNLYTHFTSKNIWPRGFPIEYVKESFNKPIKTRKEKIKCPIQQSLADLDPDVDALYRLLFELPLSFDVKPSIAIGKGAWCPFNSQNTAWYKEAFMLMYLPSYCSFRMTDIWRSFITQRIAWEYNWNILFNSSTMYQERNIHDYMKDFHDEIPGYLNNNKIIKILEDLKLSKNIVDIGKNLIYCYEELIKKGFFNMKELDLVKSWVNDVDRFSNK